MSMSRASTDIFGSGVTGGTALMSRGGDDGGVWVACKLSSTYAMVMVWVVAWVWHHGIVYGQIELLTRG